MDKEKINSIIRQLKKDTRFKKLETSFAELPAYRLPVKDLAEEIETIHMGRVTRRLKAKSTSLMHDLVAGMLDDGSKRSRLTEIIVACVRTQKHLDDALERLESYFMYEYGTLLYSFKTKAEREKFLQHHVLHPFLKYSSKLASIRLRAELIVTDIDKFSYTYRNLVEAAKLLNAPVGTQL